MHSFDYDPFSVACTLELRRRFFPDDPEWIIEQGFVLDRDFLQSLGRYDIVYSWGVLHHTGKMWEAIDNVSKIVNQNGMLFIAIYNDQGGKSIIWLKVKQIYCSSRIGRLLVLSIFIPYMFLMAVAASIAQKENRFAAYKKKRGMSIVYDWFDWLGGYPFEVAKVEHIFLFLRNRGFRLRNLKTTNSSANNQFVFIKE